MQMMSRTLSQCIAYYLYSVRVALTSKLGYGGLGQGTFPSVLVLSVEAAHGAVLQRAGQGAAVHHLSDQHVALRQDDFRLGMRHRQVGLLVGHPAELHQTDGNISNN